MSDRTSDNNTDTTTGNFSGDSPLAIPPIDATDTALILEGGGMRNSYTAACVDQLMAHNIRFGWVGGISAGSSHTVNFLSGDRKRARESFLSIPSDPRGGGIKSLLQGTGYFHAEYIYEIAGGPDQEMPFDFDTFFADPTPFKIGAVRADTGESVYWGRGDQSSPLDLMRQVRASSTVPGLMPMPEIDGVSYVDGAIGESGGIPLPEAIRDGFDKFLIIGTKPRNYVRPPLRSPQLVRMLARKYPAVAELSISRHQRYNATRELMDELERQGKAMIFYPENMLVSNGERRLSKLLKNYELGLTQTQREFPRWKEFIQS